MLQARPGSLGFLQRPVPLCLRGGQLCTTPRMCRDGSCSRALRAGGTLLCFAHAVVCVCQLACALLVGGELCFSLGVALLPGFGLGAGVAQLRLEAEVLFLPPP